MRTQLIAAAIGLTACGSAGPPATPATPPAPPLGVADATLRAWTTRELEPRVPSAVVGIVDRTGLRWHHAVGARDARGGAPPDRSTVYRIGSITKLVTATALLQLRDAGKLDLDDPVSRWIPELPALGASSPPVTIRHLATHTSGIPSIGDGSARYWDGQRPDRTALFRALAAPLAFAPGSRSAYSNAGMALAGEIVARASGEPFRAYVGAHVLAPIGLHAAAWDRADVPPARLALGTAPGVIDPPHWELGAFEPAGGLYANLDDMTAFARFALGGTPDVLAPASLAEAQRPHPPLPGPHGLAWIVGGDGAQRFAAHTGSTGDYSASLFVLPEAGFAAIVLASGPDAALVECVALQLVRAAATGREPATCTPALAAEQRAAAEIALARLRTVLADPTDDAIAAAFAPAFLAQMSPATIAALARQLHDNVGACARHELAEPGGIGVRGVLHCARGTVTFEIAADPAPPHHIQGLLFRDP